MAVNTTQTAHAYQNGRFSTETHRVTLTVRDAELGAALDSAHQNGWATHIVEIEPIGEPKTAAGFGGVVKTTYPPRRCLVDVTFRGAAPADVDNFLAMVRGLGGAHTLVSSQ